MPITAKAATNKRATLLMSIFFSTYAPWPERARFSTKRKREGTCCTHHCQKLLCKLRKCLDDPLLQQQREPQAEALPVHIAAEAANDRATLLMPIFFSTCVPSPHRTSQAKEALVAHITARSFCESCAIFLMTLFFSRPAMHLGHNCITARSCFVKRPRNTLDVHLQQGHAPGSQTTATGQLRNMIDERIPLHRFHWQAAANNRVTEVGTRRCRANVGTKRHRSVHSICGCSPGMSGVVQIHALFCIYVADGGY